MLCMEQNYPNYSMGEEKERVNLIASRGRLFPIPLPLTEQIFKNFQIDGASDQAIKLWLNSFI